MTEEGLNLAVPGLKILGKGEYHEVPVRCDFVYNAKPVIARSIRAHAKNQGICPLVHPGEGGKAWLRVVDIAV